MNLIPKSKTKHLLMKKTKFPLPHVVLEDKKEAWILCTSAITAMGISAMMDRHFPGYKGHIASESYFEELKKTN